MRGLLSRRRWMLRLRCVGVESELRQLFVGGLRTAVPGFGHPWAVGDGGVVDQLRRLVDIEVWPLGQLLGGEFPDVSEDLPPATALALVHSDHGEHVLLQ